MLTYNKMMKLHNELESSLAELQHHLEHILGDIGYEYGVSTQIKVDEGNCLTIGFYDPVRYLEVEAVVADDKEFKQMMNLQTTDELLSFLSTRTIA